MIERTTVNGKRATVAYLDDDFNPVSKEDATLVKVIYDDGTRAFMAGPETKEDDHERSEQQ